MSAPPFISGVIEGFYGRPWTGAQRRQLFQWLQQWGLNTYMYAPKDDLKHRALWRECYDRTEAAELKRRVADSQACGLDFVYALAPGLDIHYATELPKLQSKLRQVAELGVRSFAILFDDIPQRMRAADTRRFGSFAAAQSAVANELFHWLPQVAARPRLWFCPTIYCGRMAAGAVARCAYLRELGERLAPSIDVFWTGPEIVSETISPASIRELRKVLRRAPLIWDNLHANDYDRRRIYLGPYAGRPAQLRSEVRGILCNPNCEFPLNYVPLRTFANYTQARRTWNPRNAFKRAIAAWRPAFASRTRNRMSRRDLEWMGDAFYLPFAFGPQAAQFVNDYTRLLRVSPERWGRARSRFNQSSQALAALLTKVTELTDRDLCYALYRHVWDLKEEIALMQAYVRWRQFGPRRGERFVSGEHRPRLYRGGLVAALQRQLPMDDAGHFTSALSKSGRDR